MLLDKLVHWHTYMLELQRELLVLGKVCYPMFRFGGPTAINRLQLYVLANPNVGLLLQKPVG